MGTGRWIDELDENLIRLAVAGNNEALETLVRRYKDWVFNVAIRMTGAVHEAEDVTQEILIKLITKLSTFRFQSGFRTWLYRMTVNHFLSMKKKGKEHYLSSFDRHREFFESLGNRELADGDGPHRGLVIEETKTECLLGMLLCLERGQRIVFILGGIFGLDGRTAAAVLDMTEANFRKRLSRARRDLKNYMDQQCGLMNPDNPCRCSRKARAAVEAGYVRPDDLQFADHRLKRVRDFINRERITREDVFTWREAEVYREQPYKIFEDEKIAALINGVPD